MTAREKFRQEVAEALTDWRLGTIPFKPSGAETAIFHEAISDIIKLRLRIAYMPIFETLERILENLRADPYAPPNRVDGSSLAFTGSTSLVRTQFKSQRST